MQILNNVSAIPFSTFRFDVRLSSVTDFSSVEELGQHNLADRPVILGEGSNTIFMHSLGRPIYRFIANSRTVYDLNNDFVLLHVEAGHNWHQLIQLDGLLRTSVDGLPLLGQNIEATGQWPVRAQQVDYAAFSDMIGRTFYPALLYQHGGTVLLPHYKSVVLPPEKHRGYALQWLLLAVAVIGVALAASHTGSTQDE